MNLPRKRALAFLGVLLPAPVLALVGALFLNAYVDPYWMLPAFGDRAGIRYCVDDERQNKINKMIYGGVTADSILIGTSRSAFFDTTYFQSKVFNLAVNGMRPVEQPEYLRMFSRYVKPPKYISIGLDFFGYLEEENDYLWAERAQAKEKDAVAFDYRLKTLFDLGSLKKSLSTLTECSAASHDTIPTHRYDGVRTVGRAPRNPATIEVQLKYFANLYKSPIDKQYRAHLQQIKQAAPHSTFHAYIPPIGAELFGVLMKSGHAADYQEWLDLVTAEFGSVIQFSGVNSFTSNPANFLDTHHTYPDLTARMIAIIEGRAPAGPDGFGGRIIARPRGSD